MFDSSELYHKMDRNNRPNKGYKPYGEIFYLVHDLQFYMI